MTRKEKKEELIGLFSTGAIFIGDLIDECFEFGRNDAINEACEWLENNLDGYLVIKEDNYEGCVKACYIHCNVYRDFEESMKGGEYWTTKKNIKRH